MSSQLHHTSSHPLLRWWRSLDLTIYGLSAFLMFFGIVVVMLASVGVADVYDLDQHSYYFAKRQLIFVLLALPLITVLSTLSINNVRRLGLALALFAFVGIVLTLVMGSDVKGASRWIYLFGFSLQPTELMKPALVILTASLLSVTQQKAWLKNFVISLILLAVICAVTFMQPDFGMVLMFGSVWFVQAYLSGIPFVWVLWMLMGGVATILGAYNFLPHVKSRIERFFDPSSGDSYQVDQAREALLNGGLFGQGVGEGVVKHHLPDAHTDFIFAVIAEEFGLLICLALLGVYAIIVFRSFGAILDKEDKFVFLAGFGLILTFALQALINVCVVLNLLPTTGMTLPFISYGGSAMLGVSFTLGFLLALMRKRGKNIVN